MRLTAATVLMAFALAMPAEAQQLTAALSAYAPFGTDDLDADLPVSGELRVTVPVSDRFALEPFVTLTSGHTEGFYGAQLRQRLGSLTSRAYVFALYGVAGYYSSADAVPPVIGHFGLGLHRPVSSRLAFRPEVQLVTLHVVPIGVRFVAGISVALANDF